MRRLSVLVLLLLLGCGTGDGWFGKTEPPPLPGQRQDVLRRIADVAPDPDLQSVAVEFNQPATNLLWPMHGGFPDHAMGNLALGADLTLAWRADIGQGSSRDGYLLSQPIVADNRVYTLDAASRLRAFDLQSGKLLWDMDIAPEREDNDNIASGGIAWDRGIIYAATGYADIIAVAADSGKILWRQPVSSPLRTPPIVALDKILAVPVDNRLTTLTAKDGLLAWNFEGVSESAALLGGAAPAISTKGIAVVPFNNGDLIAFDVNSGRPLWQESLVLARRGESMSSIASVQAAPVILENLVLAIGHNNRTMAIDIDSGERLWDLPIGGVQTPWVARNFLFMIDNDNRLLAIALDRGSVKWATALPKSVGGKNALRYAGPVLAGGRLWVVGSDAKLHSFDVQTGQAQAVIALPDGVVLQPVVADRTLLLLTQNGQLLAYR